MPAAPVYTVQKEGQAEGPMGRAPQKSWNAPFRGHVQREAKEAVSEVGHESYAALLLSPGLASEKRLALPLTGAHKGRGLGFALDPCLHLGSIPATGSIPALPLWAPISSCPPAHPVPLPVRAASPHLNASHHPCPGSRTTDSNLMALPKGSCPQRPIHLIWAKFNSVSQPDVTRRPKSLTHTTKM